MSGSKNVFEPVSPAHLFQGHGVIFRELVPAGQLNCVAESRARIKCFQQLFEVFARLCRCRGMLALDRLLRDLHMKVVPVLDVVPSVTYHQLPALREAFRQFVYVFPSSRWRALCVLTCRGNGSTVNQFIWEGGKWACCCVASAPRVSHE